MKILHYFLGFPPYRTGGLTKYSFDMMTAQAQQNHEVSALWPGEMKLLSKAVKIRNRGKVAGVTSYELINPLPVALDEGVTDFEAYTAACDKGAYETFLKKLQPDVIHIHTLMGLHKEFLEVANACGIRTVYTSHDYYGICPKVTLYRYGTVCQQDHDCKDCIACNLRALSIKKITIMQSPLYRKLKNFPLVKMLRKRHRGEFFAEETLPELSLSQEQIDSLSRQYQQLRAYYVDMLSVVDMMHFNSTVSEGVYRKYFTPKDSQVLTITHRDVKDRRNHPHKESDTLRIACLAPAKPFKGYNVLKQALDELWAEGKHDFILRLYSPVPSPAPYMQVREEGFSHAELGNIMEDTDVLVAPSVWYETFGFTVLEALSFGVPVITTDHVGAKDIVNDCGIVTTAGSVVELKEAICALTPERLLKLRETIAQTAQIKSWEQFLEENYKLYQ